MNCNDFNKILIKNNLLKVMHVDIEPVTMKYNLLLSLSNNENFSDDVSFYFYDVSNVKIGGVGGGLTQFMHLKISTVDVLNDRNKYILEDVEDEKISFEFNSVDLLK